MDIKVEDLKVLFSEEQLQTRIKELAQEILTKYSDEIDDIVMASTKVRGV